MIEKEFPIKGIQVLFTQKPLDLRAITQKDKLRRQIKEIENHFSQKPKEIYTCNQVHGDHIFQINQSGLGEEFYYGRFLRDGDGMITNQEGIALVTKVADCVPILLFDPLNQVQASIHSGWRGTQKRIAKKAISLMEKNYQSKRENIYAYIGPAIGWEDFEVRQDVSSLWKETFSFANEVVKEKNADHQLIDLKETNRRILLEEKILPDHIYLSRKTTYQDPSLHSYRRDQPDFGINGMISMILPK